MKISKEKIEIRMAEKEMSKSELAACMETTRSQLSTILKKGTCATQIAGRLAHALNVAVSDIIE